MHWFLRLSLMALAALGLMACVQPPAPDAPESSDLSGAILLKEPKATAGRCYASAVKPAVIESVIEQRQAKGGFESLARQKLVQERQTLWFETLCPKAMPATFIADIQRALMARGFYRGEINGRLTPATTSAIRSYQSQNGLPSAVLSLKAARYFGLI